jgi:hypothetical protein
MFDCRQPDCPRRLALAQLWIGGSWDFSAVLAVAGFHDSWIKGLRGGDGVDAALP